MPYRINVSRTFQADKDYRLLCILRLVSMHHSVLFNWLAMNLPQQMQCIGFSSPGGPEVLHLVDRPLPVPKPGEVLINVAAAGINRADCYQRQGAYPPPPGASDILGLEIAGTIAALGQGVSAWKVGDKVCALVSGGAYAEFCTAHGGSCFSLPSGYDWVQAAALPETA